MLFIHIPKTSGTSIRQGVPCNFTKDHQRLRDLEKVDGPTFSIIRNPYDRAVSMVSHCIKHKKIDKQDFKHWWTTTLPIKLHKDREVYFQEPMVNYLTIDGEVKVDTLIEFTEIEERIKELFGVTLPHENAGKRERDYRWYYDDKMYEIITQLYQDDITTFNYKF